MKILPIEVNEDEPSNNDLLVSAFNFGAAIVNDVDEFGVFIVVVSGTVVTGVTETENFAMQTIFDVQ